MSESESLDETEEKSNPSRIVIYGEVLYDCFPDGRQILGGAPFNVAWGLKGFGHHPRMVTAVGSDAEGEAICETMSDWGLQRDGVQVNALHPTGRVEVTFQDDEPQYEICEPSAWDYIQPTQLPDAEMIYHGSLVLRNAVSRNSFQKLVSVSKAKRFFDVNLREPHFTRKRLERWIKSADWVKLNIDELAYVLHTERIDFGYAEMAVDTLRKQYGVANVLLTAGGEGALIKGSYGRARLAPAPKPEKFEDTVGAGDSFTAVTIAGILAREPVDTIIEKAARFASKVCGLRGATTTDRSFYQHQ